MSGGASIVIALPADGIAIVAKLADAVERIRGAAGARRQLAKRLIDLAVGDGLRRAQQPISRAQR